MTEVQLELFTETQLKQEVPMVTYTIQEARKKANKELVTVHEEKKIPFGVAFLGTDFTFGLAMYVVKFKGECSKFMGKEEMVMNRWNSL